MKRSIALALITGALLIGGSALADPQQTSGGIGCEGPLLGSGATCGFGGDTYTIPAVPAQDRTQAIPGEGQPIGACVENVGLKILLNEGRVRVRTPGMTAGSLESPEVRVLVTVIPPFVDIVDVDPGDVTLGSQTGTLAVSPNFDPQVVPC